MWTMMMAAMMVSVGCANREPAQKQHKKVWA
jgi:hypothetical protein